MKLYSEVFVLLLLKHDNKKCYLLLASKTGVQKMEDIENEWNTEFKV